METQTKVAHTPGPWEVSNSGMAIYTRDHRLLVSTGGMSEQDKANIRLIAKLPELVTALDTLKDLHSRMNCICQFEPFVGRAAPCEVCRVGAVIADAECEK